MPGILVQRNYWVYQRYFVEVFNLQDMDYYTGQIKVFGAVLDRKGCVFGIWWIGMNCSIKFVRGGDAGKVREYKKVADRIERASWRAAMPTLTRNFQI